MKPGDAIRVITTVDDYQQNLMPLVTGMTGKLISLDARPTSYRNHADAVIEVNGEEWNVNRLDIEPVST